GINNGEKVMVRKSNSPSKRKRQQQETNASAAPVVPSKADANHMGNTRMTEMSLIEYAEDLSEAEAPVPLPEGDYIAEIRQAEIKTSGRGNQYVNVTFHVSPEQYPADF